MPLLRRILALVIVAPATLSATAQMFGETIIRYAYARATLSSGESTSEIEDGSLFGPPFIAHASASLAAPGGPSGEANARQNSSIGPAFAGGSFRATCDVESSTSPVTSEAYGLSYMFYTFNLAVTSNVRFVASAEIDYSDLAFDDDPTDRGGYASVLLMNGAGTSTIAGLTLDLDAGADSLAQSMLLPAGYYRIVAHAELRASSAEVTGAPPANGLGHADVRFSLRVVPPPGTLAPLALSLVLCRRRRVKNAGS